MLIDARKSDFSGPRVVYDACISGSGFAGITVARELAGKGLKVALLEAGSEEYTDQSQDIYEGKTNEGPDVNYWGGLAACRLRYFGGTSNHWAGLCFVPDAADFEASDRWGMPGWPIRKSEIDGFFDRAAEIIDVTGQTFDVAGADQWKSSKLRMAGHIRSTPTRLNEKYFSEISEDPNIDLYLNCNTVDIRLNDNLDHVEEFVCRNYQGTEFRFRSKHFLLACGAVENARILLNCDTQVKSGIGNHSDFVGRCFMEHLNVEVGRFVASDAGFWKSGMVALKPTREFMLSQGILNAILSFTPDSNPKTYGRLRVLKRYVRDAVCNSKSLLDLSRHLAEFNCPGDGVISTLCEQSPNRNSRIKLGDEKDALGLRRVILDWQLNDRDRRSVRTVAIEAAKELARQDLARVQLNSRILDENERLGAGGHCHQMGTTRMSSDPAHGVVDPNSKIHGIDNFYVAGSSVYSTGGGNNPTMELVQLSLRLADHLVQKLGA